jgi:hypothetical protein
LLSTTYFKMDFVNKFTGGDNKNQQSNEQSTQGSSGQQQSSGSGGFLGGIGDKLNSAAGGGKESEKNEDYLDKGMETSGFTIAGITNTSNRC